MPSPPEPSVVLVRPQHQGNIGATARAMANMGLERLFLVEPAPALGDAARSLAVGADHVLDGAERRDSLAEALEPFERAVGTTSGRSRQLEQTVITARELPAALAGDPGSVALVFGPEASGLTTDEMALLDPLVSIPCAARQPTLNLAQAVLLVAYELYLAPPGLGEAPITEPHSTEPRSGKPGPTADRLARSGDIDRLLRHVEEVLVGVGFDRDDTYRGVVRDLRQLAARCRPTAREVQIFHGICRRTLHALAGHRRD